VNETGSVYQDRVEWRFFILVVLTPQFCFVNTIVL